MSVDFESDYRFVFFAAFIIDKNPGSDHQRWRGV